jgi:hypothetical protein
MAVPVLVTPAAPQNVRARIGLARVNYVEGQLLSVADLRAEQDYWLARQRRHNRFLHG